MSLPPWVTGEKPPVERDRSMDPLQPLDEPMFVRTHEGLIVIDRDPRKTFRLEENGVLRSAYCRPRGKALVKQLKRLRRQPRRVSRLPE